MVTKSATSEKFARSLPNCVIDMYSMVTVHYYFLSLTDCLLHLADVLIKSLVLSFCKLCAQPCRSFNPNCQVHLADILINKLPGTPCRGFEKYEYCQVHFAEILINKLSGRPCRGWPWTGVKCTSQSWGQAVCRLCARRRDICAIWFLKKYFHISCQGNMHKLPGRELRCSPCEGE